MLLEVSSEDLRDIAAAVHSARKRQPDLDVMAQVERVVLVAIRKRTPMIELADQHAQALRNALLMRAHDQRNTSESLDYADLAERIRRALESSVADLGVADPGTS